MEKIHDNQLFSEEENAQVIEIEIANVENLINNKNNVVNFWPFNQLDVTYDAWNDFS